MLRLGDALAVFECSDGPPIDAAEVARAAVPGDAATVQAPRHGIAAPPDPAPALLLGETGTGKQRAAVPRWMEVYGIEGSQRAGGDW